MNRSLIALCKAVYKPLVRWAAYQILEGRLLDLEKPNKGRWLHSDVRGYLNETWARCDSLIPVAGLEKLPTYGNRHNVFLAVMTTAAYQVMIERGVSSRYAIQLVGDLCWKIYALMLKTVSIPYRIATRDPGRRMEKILHALMVFPFSAPGAPGYEVRVWTEGSDTYTYWTHCPPQSFVRRLIELKGDRGELTAFYNTWCLYDWPGADVLVNDGKHGHYSRVHTLSKGDSICDMCWNGVPKVRSETTQRSEFNP